MKIGFGLITCQAHPEDTRTGSGRYRDAIEQAVVAEQLGFDSVWVSEHHFVDDGYLPSVLPMCAAIAARTGRITIGTAVVLTDIENTRSIWMIFKAGIKLAAGTDAGGTVGYNFQGYNTPWELKLLVECGLTPMEALVAGTVNGAEVIGAERVLGTIESGKFADMLILGSNPLDDIGNIRDIDLIIQDGKVYERDFFAYKK